MARSKRHHRLISDDIVIPWRIQMLSKPKYLTPRPQRDVPFSTGVRKAALNPNVSRRVIEAAYPYARNMEDTKLNFHGVLNQKRLDFLTESIDRANHTIYGKLTVTKEDSEKEKDVSGKVKKADKVWSYEEMLLRRERIKNLATPKKDFANIMAEERMKKSINELMPRILELSQVPLLKRLSKQERPRDPTKVNPKALKYEITERVEILAKPRKYPDDPIKPPLKELVIEEEESEEILEEVEQEPPEEIPLPPLRMSMKKK